VQPTRTGQLGRGDELLYCQGFPLEGVIGSVQCYGLVGGAFWIVMVARESSHDPHTWKV
jgi:hypothetical protein